MIGPGIPWETVENAIQQWVVTATGIVGNLVYWWGQGGEVPSTTPYVTLHLGAVQREGQEFIQYQGATYTFAPIAVSAVVGDVLTATAHGLAQGDGGVRVDAAKYGLAIGTDYWVVPVDANHLKLASTFQNAMVPTTLVLSADTGGFNIISTSATRKAGAELTALSRGMRKVNVTIQCYGGTAEGSPSPVSLLDAVVALLPRRAPTLRAAGVGVMSCGPVRSTNSIVNTTIFEPRAVLDLTLSLGSEVQDPETIIERVLTQSTIDGVVGSTTTLP